MSADALNAWIAAETRFAAAAMVAAISATHLVMERPGFGQRVVPRPGSVLASPVVAHYDPEPDYFFHWFRDSSLVIDALRQAHAQGYVGAAALGRLREFVEFSLGLRSLEGRAFLHSRDIRSHVQPAYLQYLRPDTEIAALCGANLAADVRVNADGTPDFLRWARPQADGPALRCIALLRWGRELPRTEAPLRALLGELISGDLALTLQCADEPCFDIWEEHSGQHYYTQLAQSEALQLGAVWLDERNEHARARGCAAAAAAIAPRLDALWSAAAGCYRSRTPATASDSVQLDMAVILAVLHAGRSRGSHSVLDPRVQATLSALEELFERDYAINRELPPGRAAAMGRYANDRYFSGGAYYFATLAAAEFYFRVAAALRAGDELVATDDNRRFRERLGAAPGAVAGASVATLARERGDAFLRTVQAFTPCGGELSEQFDRTTGAQTSARHLSWSYAALITAVASRARAARTTRA